MSIAILKVVFWVSLGLAFYAYAGYPLVLWLCSRRFGRDQTAPPLEDRDLPTLSFLIAALHRVRYHGAIVYGGFLTVFAGAAIWVAGRHVWIQSQPPGTVPACGAPLDTMMQMFPLLEVVRKVMTGGGECGTIDWTFLGLSMPMWVLISAAALGLIGLVNNAFLPVRGVRR